MPDQESDSLPVVQKLVVVFGDGTTLMLAMNKSFELNIVQHHKFNYDEKGFFAFDQIGSQGKLNFMHDYRFNSKKVPGTSKSGLYILQDDPNQNLKFVLAITLKICISDPMFGSVSLF